MQFRAAATYPRLRLGVRVVALGWVLGLSAATGCMESVPLRSGNGYFVVEDKSVQYTGSAFYERFFGREGREGRYRLRMGGWDGERGMVIASDVPLYGDTLTVGKKSGPEDREVRTWVRFEPAGEDAIFWSDSGKVWTVPGFDIRMIEFRLFLSRRDSNGVESVILKGGMGLGLK